MSEFSKSVEAEMAATGIAVDVTSWNWSDHFSIGPDYAVPHDTLVFNLSQTAPKGMVCVGNGRQPGPPSRLGVLSFWPAGAYRVDRQSGGQARNVNCVFRGTWFRDLTGVHIGAEPTEIQGHLDLKNWQLCDMMAKLASEALAPGFAAQKMVEGLGLEIAVQLARHLRHIDSRSGTMRQTLSPLQIERVIRYVDGFPGYLPDIEVLASLCGISSRHFRRLFKETTNQTVHDYAKNAWAEKAKTLLRDTSLPLKHVWSQFGFSGANSFTMAFRRATGEAPASYRRHHQSLITPLPGSLARQRSEISRRGRP